MASDRIKSLVAGLPGPGDAGPPEPDADDGMALDDDKATEVSACQEFMDAAGLKGDANEVCEAFKRFLDILKPETSKPGF